MKWKIYDEQTPYDYVLWHGRLAQGRGVRHDDTYLVQGLIRNRIVTGREAHDCRDHDGNPSRHEQLTFSSRKAAARYVRRHFNDIESDWISNNPSTPDGWTHVIARHCHHNIKGDVVFYTGPGSRLSKLASR